MPTVPSVDIAPETPALDVIGDYLRQLAAGGASRALVRQRGWALREAVLFAAALARHDLTAGEELTGEQRVGLRPATAQVPLRELTRQGFADVWLALADPVLRGVPTPVPATQRARVASLRALAGFAGADVPDHLEGKPRLREVLTPPQITAALGALSGRLPGRGPHDQVRLAAVLAVMSVWPVRSAELAALRVAQVRDDGGSVAVAVGPGAVPVLRGVAAQRVREWLAVRAEIAAALQGGRVHAFWTSIRSNSRPGDTRSLPLPAGMPLRPRGLQRAYARSVAAANLAYAGVPGFPLPASLDLLRRSLLAAPPAGTPVSRGG
jgi:integrase